MVMAMKKQKHEIDVEKVRIGALAAYKHLNHSTLIDPEDLVSHAIVAVLEIRQRDKTGEFEKVSDSTLAHVCAYRYLVGLIRESNHVERVDDSVLESMAHEKNIIDEIDENERLQQFKEAIVRIRSTR